MREADASVMPAGALGFPLGAFLGPAEPVIRRLSGYDRLHGYYREAARAANGRPLLENLLELLNIGIDIEARDQALIPQRGAVIVVANHPFGIVEGAILSVILGRVRPDFKVLANSFLSHLEELREHLILVSVFGNKRAANRLAVRECEEWLASGKLLATFPAGEVSHLHWQYGGISDPPWNRSAARLARRAGCGVVPVFFEGVNGLAFQLSGLLHPALRTARLCRETLNKRGTSIRVRVGGMIPASQLQSIEHDRAASEYLRCRTYLLSERGRALRYDRRPAPALVFGRALDKEVPGEALAEEIENFPDSARLCQSDDLSVYLASANKAPWLLSEIGRLRELTFRQAGEGTGNASDLDSYDRYYQQLIVWDHAQRRVVGGYRIAATTDVLPRLGIAGLYTHKLFRFDPSFFEQIGPAFELGRSFIRPEYQKQYAPLFLLWKGIGQYVVRRPECAMLFGAVSISCDYAPASRQIMVDFLAARRAEQLAGLVTPRHPYRSRISRWHLKGLQRFLRDADDLSAPIADLEPDGRGVPILLRQYARIGARVLAFNIDAEFSNVLDALVIVDLRQTPPPVRDRYLTKEGARAFLSYHALSAVKDSSRFHAPETSL